MSYNSQPVPMYQSAYIEIYCDYYDGYCYIDLGKARLYKNGIYVNTSTDDRFVLDESIHDIRFTISNGTEADVGIYEIRLVDYDISWFTVIEFQGQLICFTYTKLNYVPISAHSYANYYRFTRHTYNNYKR